VPEPLIVEDKPVEPPGPLVNPVKTGLETQPGHRHLVLNPPRKDGGGPLSDGTFPLLFG
jgi:hypothetical protein